MPIWQGHGTMDPLIPLPLAQMSHEFLKGLGLTASLSTCARDIAPLLLRLLMLFSRYKMEHRSHPQEMADVLLPGCNSACPRCALVLASLLVHTQLSTHTFPTRLQQVTTASLPSEADLRTMGSGDLKRLASSRFVSQIMYCGLDLAFIGSRLLYSLPPSF